MSEAILEDKSKVEDELLIFTSIRLLLEHLEQTFAPALDKLIAARSTFT